MLPAAAPAAAATAADVLRVALFHKRLRVRILVIVACLASCRRGRAAMRKVASPFSVLLWCAASLLRLRDRDGNNLLHGSGGSNGPPPLARAGGWRRAFARSSRTGDRDGGGGGGGELLEAQQGGAGLVGSRQQTRMATLGERGMRLAFDHFRQLQRDGACSDVTLAVGGKLFKAHKCVLAAQSSPLRAMFEGSFKEGNESVIALRDVEPAGFSLLLDFLYGRGIEVVGENVEALLDLSARYGVSPLRRHCCAFLAASATPGTACSLLALADRYDCHRLRRQLLAYTLECFPSACGGGASDGFRHLSPTLVAEILRDDRLDAGPEGEVTVFWAAASWLEAEPSRRTNADEILSHVRFGLVSAETLAGAVEAHPLLQSRAGRAFVHEAYRYQALPPESRDDLLATSMEARARPRAAAAAAAAAVGGPAGVGATLSSSFAASGRAPPAEWGRPSGGDAFAGDLGGVNFADEEGGSSCDEGGEGGPGRDGGREDAGLEGETGGPATSGSENGGGGSGGRGWEDARAARGATSDGAEELSVEEMRVVVAGGGGGNDHDEVEDTNPPSKADASPSRRPWGAGLRTYV